MLNAPIVSHGLVQTAAVAFVVGAATVPVVRWATGKSLWSLVLFRVALVVASVFWVWHYQWFVGTRGGWGAGADLIGPLGRMPVYELAAPLLALLLLASALWGARHRPLVAALYPAALAVSTLVFVDALFATDASLGVYVPADGTARVWFALWSVAATLFLVVWAWGDRESRKGLRASVDAIGERRAL